MRLCDSESDDDDDKDYKMDKPVDEARPRAEKMVKRE